MYICENCGCITDEVIRCVEPQGAFYYGCPQCRGYLDEAEYCDWCGEATPVADMDYVDGAFVCFRCKWEAQLEEEAEWNEG